MSSSADQFLNLLQERKLLAQVTIDGLRRQVASAAEPVTAHQLARVLQRKGKLTAFQARELLNEVDDALLEVPLAQEQDEPAPSKPKADDELGLAEEEDHKHDARKELSAEVEQKAGNKKSSDASVDPPAVDVDLGDAATPSALADGLDSLLDDPLMSSGAPLSDPLQPAGKKASFGFSKQGRKLGKRQAASWDSPLIIVGGGVLLLLVLVAAVLTFVLTRGSGDELYAAAEQDYLNGAYGQAISKFEKFAARHDSHPNASMARVRVGLAKIRDATSEKNWAKALTVSEEVLPKIATEEAFAQVRGELSSLLPDIADGFAQQASESPDKEQSAKLVGQYEQAMTLVDNAAYLPASQRASLTPRLDRSRENVAVVVRELEQQSRLEEAIAEIQALTSEGDALAAYAVRDELLQSYPRLREDVELASVTKAISMSLREQVTGVDISLEPTTQERASPVIAEVALADVTGEPIPELEGEVAPIVVDGALYVLAADSGKLLWRRFVGRETRSAKAVDETPGADLLVVDSVHHDLLRLRAADGKLLWRLPIGEAFDFTLAGDRLLVSMKKGQLIEIDAATGQCQRGVRCPQPIAVAPCVTESGRILLVADHSNIYVLNGESLACEDVYFLAHTSGTITEPPVVVATMVILPQQAGLRRATLHMLRESDESPLFVRGQPPLSFESRFGGPLVAGENQLAFLDAYGAITLLGVDPANAEAPVEVVAQSSGGRQLVDVHAALHDRYLLVGTNRLAAYRATGTRGTLAPRWVNHDGDAFIAPLVTSGSYVIHARRAPNQAGIIVAATTQDSESAQDAGRPLWETAIVAGTPTSGMQPSLDGDSLVAATATGDIYEIQSIALTTTTMNSPTVRASRKGAFTRTLTFGDAVVGEVNAILVGPGQSPSLSGEQLSASPSLAGSQNALQFELSATWRNGLLVPSHLGRIEYFTLRPEDFSLFPFQPRMELAKRPRWLRPCVIDDQHFAVVGQQRDLYLVGISNRGAPHLAAVAQAKLTADAVTPPLVHGEKLLLITRGQQHDLVQMFELPSLSGESQFALPGRLAWEPHVAGDLLLVSTIDGDLQAYTIDGEPLWTHPLQGELPVGAPLVLQPTQEIVLATSSGAVLRIDANEGSVVSETRVGQPLADGPVLLGNRIALRAADGTVLLIANEGAAP